MRLGNRLLRRRFGRLFEGRPLFQFFDRVRHAGRRPPLELTLDEFLPARCCFFDFFDPDEKGIDKLETVCLANLIHGLARCQ